MSEILDRKMIDFILVISLTMIVIVDIKIKRIFHSSTSTLIFCGLLTAMSASISALSDCVIGAICGLFLTVIIGEINRFIYKKPGFGGGDAWLFCGVGACVGLQGILFIMLMSALLCSLYSIIKKSYCVPYSPFIAVATIIQRIGVHNG